MVQDLKPLLLMIHRFHNHAKLSLAQTKPKEEEEEEEPFFGHESEQANHSLQEKPEQPQEYLPFMPRKDVQYFDQQKRLVPCQYPACQNKLDPIDFVKTIRDPKTNRFYCREHTAPCSRCEQVFFKEKLQKFDNGDLICELCYQELFMDCPHCHETIPKEDFLRPNGNEHGRMRNGGCTECAVECSSCERIIDKEVALPEDGDMYCEDCYSETFATCDECNSTIGRDDAEYANDHTYCDHCYNELYTACEECSDTIRQDDAFEMNGSTYCQDCYDKLGPEQYAKYTQRFNQFDYTKKDRYLHQLFKILHNEQEISIRDLKTKHPSIAAGLSELMAFAKGKPLTVLLVKKYRDNLNPEEFPIDYTVWSGIQRSIETIGKGAIEKPQLVMNILASQEMLIKLKSNRSLYDLFNSINEVSKQSTHPFVKDQIGWARLELNAGAGYLLVDEIQCDHSNASFELKQANSKIWADINAITTNLADRFLANKDDCISLMFAEGFDPDIQKEGRDLYERYRSDNEFIGSGNEDPGQPSYYSLKDHFQKKHNLTDVATRELTKVVPALHKRLIGSKSNIFPIIKKERERIKTQYSIDDEKLNSILLTNTPEEIERLRAALKSKYSLDDESLNKLLEQYSNILKDFPNIAAQAITRFAAINQIKKIYWHTFEGGKKLKDNEPPRSLYDKVPKENFFHPTTDKPFGLNADFLEKEAKIKLFFKQANKLMNKTSTKPWWRLSDPEEQDLLNKEYDFGNGLKFKTKDIPEIAQQIDVPAGPIEHHPEKNQLLHNTLVYEQAKHLSDDPMVWFAALLHDLGKSHTDKAIWPKQHEHEELGVKYVEEVSDLLGVSKEWKEFASAVARYHLICHRAKEMSPRVLKRLFEAFKNDKQTFLSYITSCEADAKGRHGGFADRPYTQREHMLNEWDKGWDRSTPPSNLAINGNDLMQALGLKPGPELGKILKHLKELIIDNPHFNDKETLMDIAKQFLGKQQ